MNLPKNSDTQVSGENAGAKGVQARRLSRRHLLKGIAGGSAALAAARPIESLATPSPILKVTGTNNVCTVSGMQSAGTSPRPGTSYCGGKGPSYYSNPANWPNGAGMFVINGLTYRSNYLVKNANDPSKPPTIFGKYTDTTKTYLGLMSLTVDETYWLCAIFNALKFGITQYPYTPSEILAMYNSSGSTYSNALGFFKTPTLIAA